MHKIIFHLFVIIILSIPFTVYSKEEGCLRTGDYISDTFIKKIVNDLSLEKASGGLKFIFASVSQKESTLQIGLNNFHDSIYLYILPDCHTIKDVKKYSANYVFEKIDNNRFKIHNEKEDILFEYVGDNSYEWLAVQIFSGKWSDQNGNNFVFNKNGKVSVNGTLSNYTIGRQVYRDEIGIVYDIVKIDNNNYAFKISNNKLLLYEAFEWGISKEPNHTLKLINKFH